MDSTRKALVHAQPPWWVQICHLAWIGLRFFWGTLIVGLLVNIIATLVFLSQGTNLQTLFIGRMLDWGGRHLLVIVLIMVAVLMFTVLAWVGSRQKALYAPQKLHEAPLVQAHAISKRNGIIYRAGLSGVTTVTCLAGTIDLKLTDYPGGLSDHWSSCRYLSSYVWSTKQHIE